MAARNYRYYQQTDFRGGICDQQENLNPKNQVLDARNVWAPLGQCVRRPGYQAIAQYTARDDSATGAEYYFDGSTIYFGANEPFYRCAYDPDEVNTNAGCQFRYEYWNGSAWFPVDAAQKNSSTLAVVPLYSGAATLEVFFTPPANWALTTVNDLERYWLRVVVAGFQSPSATPVSLENLSIGILLDDGTGYTAGISRCLYNSGTNYVFSYIYLNQDSEIYVSSILEGGYPPTQASGAAESIGSLRTLQTPIQTTTIPEFNLAFAAYNNVVYRVTSTNSIEVAEVNSDPLIVGTDPTLGAPYRSDLVPQLSGFPEASLILNFRNLIFAAGIKGQPTLVRWSGAVNEGAFNVWPETSFETLSTAKDNSPITAMAGLGDNLVVFKQDSIWQLIYNGLDDLDLPTFIPQLVVAGVGCVSQGSIQEVRGRLIFLGEDGFYAFDGTPNIQKISENINATTQRINPAHRPFATAVNWRSKYCYMCSVALDESASNNLIFVWDYKHSTRDNNAWWLWDDIPAEFMLVTSNTALQEQVIFGNQTAGFFQLGGETDNFGEIDDYVLSGRFGATESMWKKAREVRVHSENLDGTIQYTLIGDDHSLDVDPKDIVMNSSLETAADPAPDDGCDNVQPRRRERKAPQRLTCGGFQLKVEGFRSLDGFAIGYIPQSRR